MIKILSLVVKSSIRLRVRAPEVVFREAELLGKLLARNLLKLRLHECAKYLPLSNVDKVV